MVDLDPGAIWCVNVHRIARWYLDNLVVRVDRYGHHTARPVKGRSRVTSTTPLTLKILEKHVLATTRSDIVGPLTVKEVDGVCYSLEMAVDVDAHGSTEAECNETVVLAWYNVLVNLGYNPLLTTEGNGGYHLRTIYKQPQESCKLQALGRWLTADWQSKGLAAEPEIYPKQTKLTGKKCGNWLRLPGKHHKRDAWSTVWDGSKWLEGAVAIEYMLSLRTADTLLLPSDIDLYLNVKPKKREKKITCDDYVWASNAPLVARVVGALLGHQDVTDEALLGLAPGERAIARYLGSCTTERYCYLLAYPVAAINSSYSKDTSYTDGVAPPPGYKWVPPADPVKIAAVDQVLNVLPQAAKESWWAPKATKGPTSGNPSVTVQTGVPTWTAKLPPHIHSKGRVDFDRAAREFDLGAYLGLGQAGGKVLCPAHPDRNPSMSIYFDHGRWFYRCWSCNVHGDSIAYLAHTHNCSRYDAARKILTQSARLPKVAPGTAQINRPPAYTNPEWQLIIIDFIEYTHSLLLGPSTGREPREYLKARGVTTDIINIYKLGWNPHYLEYSDIEDWPQGLRLPRGITIPWLLPGRDYTDQYDANIPIYAGVNVRLLGRPNLSDPPRKQNGDPAPKYFVAQGSVRIYPYPYGVVKVPGAPLIIVEGEFDALLASHRLSSRYNVATWCSAASTPVGVHVPDEFKILSRWYLLFDADKAGQEATDRWLAAYPDAKVLHYPPGVNDFTELCRSPAVLAEDIAQRLGY